MSTLLCRIELNKQQGVLITVDNEADKITHTIVLNSDSITTQCKASANTSTIIQKPDSISLKCKDFKLQADSISCHSSGNTMHSSGSNFMIQSSANLVTSASGNVDQKGNVVNITGASLIKAVGGLIKLQ